jgi:hypothetical protein
MPVYPARSSGQITKPNHDPKALDAIARTVAVLRRAFDVCDDLDIRRDLDTPNGQ